MLLTPGGAVCESDLLIVEAFAHRADILALRNHERLEPGDRLAQIFVFVFRGQGGFRDADDSRARLLDLLVRRHQVLRRIPQPFPHRTERISHTDILRHWGRQRNTQCRNLNPMTIAEEVRALRTALGENAATFAARWHRSPRTVEKWEQGTRQPDPLVLEGMRALAARTTKAKAKTARS